VRQGTVTVVNPLGSGVADDKLAHAYVEEMVRFYLQEEPLIESVPTYDLGDPDTREAVMPRLEELVIKPRSGLGGHGVTVCSQATEGEREQLAALIEEHPASWIAQETVALSTHPTVCEDRLEPRHVDLRPYVLGAGPEAHVAPAALTRVAFEAGSLVVNSSQNGGAKDTWLPA
jgi:carboxylate-amine ligase